MTHSEILKLAAEALVDPRTVKSYLEGKEVRTMTRARIESAAKKLRVKLRRA